METRRAHRGDRENLAGAICDRARSRWASNPISTSTPSSAATSPTRASGSAKKSFPRKRESSVFPRVAGSPRSRGRRVQGLLVVRWREKRERARLDALARRRARRRGRIVERAVRGETRTPVLRRIVHLEHERLVAPHLRK